MAVIFLFVSYNILSSYFIIDFDIAQALVCLAIVIINMIMSIIIPYKILSKKAVIEVFRK